MPEKIPTTRREFMGTLVRLSVLGALVAGVGGLVAQGRAACDRNGQCGGCPAFGGCRLPERQAAAQAQPARSAPP